MSLTVCSLHSSSPSPLQRGTTPGWRSHIPLWRGLGEETDEQDHTVLLETAKG